MTRWRCRPCRKVWDDITPSRGCRICGGPVQPVAASHDGVEFGTPGYRPAERRRSALVSAADLVAEASAPKLVCWGWPETMFPVHATGTLKGYPGSGKSTAATTFAMHVARETGLDVLYVSSEEGTGVSAINRFQRVADMLGIAVPAGVILSDAQDVHEAAADLAAYERRLGGRKGFVVIDSLTQLNAAKSFWEDLLNSGHGVVLVLHTTTTGEARGGREPEFAASFNVAVDQNGHAVISKSRWGPTGEDYAFNVRSPPPIQSPSNLPTGGGSAHVIQFPRKNP